jgi:hypothetical protein
MEPQTECIALLRFQQRLGQQQPPGFGGSASFRVAALPWLANRPGYEDWCLLDGSPRFQALACMISM